MSATYVVAAAATAAEAVVVDPRFPLSLPPNPNRKPKRARSLWHNKMIERNGFPHICTALFTNSGLREAFPSFQIISNNN